jgi:hypothetical protein
MSQNQHQAIVFKMQSDIGRLTQENRSLKQIIMQQGGLIETIVKHCEPFARYATCLPPEIDGETVLIPGTAVQLAGENQDQEIERDVSLKAADFFRALAVFKNLRSATLQKKAVAVGTQQNGGIIQ